MEKAKFYNSIRSSLFGGKLTQSQVQGMEAILNYWLAGQYKDNRWLAYMLATTYHETARTMQPIEEYGKGKGRKYGRKIKMSGVSYTIPDKIYYGRGFVQITWYENYDNLGKKLGVPLLEHPELALNLTIATKILFYGMINGSFTGKSLKVYFNSTKNDPVNARRIINGLDKANLISTYYHKFLAAILTAC